LAAQSGHPDRFNQCPLSGGKADISQLPRWQATLEGRLFRVRDLTGVNLKLVALRARKIVENLFAAAGGCHRSYGDFSLMILMPFSRVPLQGFLCPDTGSGIHIHPFLPRDSGPVQLKIQKWSWRL
jgi:hypothetical protein